MSEPRRRRAKKKGPKDAGGIENGSANGAGARNFADTGMALAANPHEALQSIIMAGNQAGNPSYQPRPYAYKGPQLLPPPPPHRYELDETVDGFDAGNQQKMRDMEAKFGGSIPGIKKLATEFQEMREHERTEMESRGKVDRQDARKKLEDALVFVGSCFEMCPVYERVRRAYENNVKALEKDADGRVSPNLAVKQFSRPAAGQPPPLPSDVRPPSVLARTLAHLTSTALPQLPASHGFIWDRTRSIRQDFTYQHYAGAEAIVCHEIIVRIHLVCLHVMAGHPADYSRQQELEQLNKALQTLGELYTLNRARAARGEPAASTENEPEFRAYQLLSHLKDPEMDYMAASLPSHIANHPLVKMARDLRDMSPLEPWALVGPYFEKVRGHDVPVLMQCLLEVTFSDVRVAGIKGLFRALHSRGRRYPLAKLEALLGFEHGEAAGFLGHFGLPVDGSGFVDFSGWTDALASDKGVPPQPCSPFITNRLDWSIVGSTGAAYAAPTPSRFPAGAAKGFHPPALPAQRPAKPSEPALREYIEQLIASTVSTETQKILDTAVGREISARAAKQAEEARKRAEVERAAAEKVAAEQRAAEQREQQRRAAEVAEQQRQAAEAAEQFRRRQQQREAFVSSVAHRLLATVLAAAAEDAQRTAAQTGQAIKMERRHLAASALHRMRRRSRKQLEQRAAEKAREAETAAIRTILSQRGPRRVSRSKPVDPLAFFVGGGSAAESPAEHTEPTESVEPVEPAEAVFPEVGPLGTGAGPSVEAARPVFHSTPNDSVDTDSLQPPRKRPHIRSLDMPARPRPARRPSHLWVSPDKRDTPKKLSELKYLISSALQTAGK